MNDEITPPPPVIPASLVQAAKDRLVERVRGLPKALSVHENALQLVQSSQAHEEKTRHEHDSLAGECTELWAVIQAHGTNDDRIWLRERKLSTIGEYIEYRRNQA